jgi:PAS domain S-box-containing protein
VLLWGPDGIMIYNDAYSAFAGGRHPKLLGSKVREGWPEVADFNDNVMKVGLSGGTLAYKDQELTLNRHGRPEQVWMNLDYSPVLNEAGEPAGIIAIVVETTERIFAERSVAESEERFRLIANSAPVPMWVSKLDGTRGFANQAYLDFLGLPYQEAIVFDWRKILHPDHLDRIVKESIAGEASLKPFVLEGRYRRSDGAWRWMRSESQPRLDAQGKHIGFIGVAHDITAAKEAADELRRLNETLEQRITERTSQLESRETQLRAILETSNQYQALLDLDGNVLYANKIALSGIKANAADVIGKPFWNAPWFAATPGAGDRFERAGRGEARRKRALGNAAASAGRRSLFRFHDAVGARPAWRRHRYIAGSGRHHRPPPGRGSAASIAENGSRRPAHRRRGA